LAIQDPGPDGVGEIAARTPTMTGGYLRDPEPVTDAEGWIRTGDLGRIDDEGWLYVTGRSKDVIIRGGENIAAAPVARAGARRAPRHPPGGRGGATRTWRRSRWWRSPRPPGARRSAPP